MSDEKNADPRYGGHWLNPWTGDRADHQRQPHYIWSPRPEFGTPSPATGEDKDND